MTMLLADRAKKVLWQPVEKKMWDLVGYSERMILWHRCRQVVFQQVRRPIAWQPGFGSRFDGEVNR